jgi:hypothetical protein
MDQNEVHIAFEILLEEIEQVVDSVHQRVNDALRAGRFDEARLSLAHAEKLAQLRERVKGLQQEWRTLFTGAPVAIPTRSAVGRRRQRRLTPRLRTPEESFRRPILEALVELGGRAAIDEVLRRVEEKMRDVLNEYDRQPLRSGEIRWRNTAQWSRLKLVQDGLIRRDSPQGIWEISEAGLSALESGQV